ncbi:hypothetical protein FB451DRAFT_313973 [Mycena latifolia]|nr:hypothetical protein FB451DRAFT_313973 [Mycena latifolia]
MDVKATVQTLSVDGLPVVAGGEDAPVKVEEVLHESEGPITQTLASDSSDVEDIQATAAEDPPEVADIPADALAVAIRPPAAVASSESEPKVGFYPAGRSGLVLSPAFNMDHGIYPPGISAEQLEVFHETKRRRDAAKTLKPPPTHLYSELPGPPSRNSTEVTVKNSRRVPASNAEASGSRQPARAARRAITAGTSQNGSSSSSMPPPPTVAPPSPARKRGDVVNHLTAESGSPRPKRAEVTPGPRKTRRSKDSS